MGRSAAEKESPWEVCADAAVKMQAIIDGLGVSEAAAALRAQVRRIEGACAVPEAEAGDPKAAAQGLIARLPLREVFQDKALADAFLSELLLTLARESSYEERRERQRKGIAEAKAHGARFGKPARALPENFEDARQAWRDGRLSMKEAAELCGLPKTTFYDAAQRAEKWTF